MSRAPPGSAAIEHGARHAAEELLPLAYEEWRRLAYSKLANERPGQTLQPTALVHETWLRLMDSTRSNWDGRTRFFAAAAEAMRRILVENARRKHRHKRGGGCERTEFDELCLAAPIPDEDLLELLRAHRQAGAFLEQPLCPIADTPFCGRVGILYAPRLQSYGKSALNPGALGQSRTGLCPTAKDSLG